MDVSTTDKVDNLMENVSDQIKYVGISNFFLSNFSKKGKNEVVRGAQKLQFYTLN